MLFQCHSQIFHNDDNDRVWSTIRSAGHCTNWLNHFCGRHHKKWQLICSNQGDHILLQISLPQSYHHWSQLEFLHKVHKKFWSSNFFSFASVSSCPGPSERAAHWKSLGMQVGSECRRQCITSTIQSLDHNFHSLKIDIHCGENFWIKSARNEHQNFCRRFGLLTFFKDILIYTDEQMKIEIRRQLLGVISSHSEIIQTKVK